ncbi:MAG: iron ABC transporter permease [Lachnospiraceae bacterium]|nr:iron ABC transporter permease [Lachnospiraceae bacterium]
MSGKKTKIKYPFSKERLKNQFLNLVTNPYNVIVFFTLLILIALIVIPLVTMIKNTFTAGYTEVFRGMIKRAAAGSDLIKDVKEGEFTLYYWWYLFNKALANEILWTPLWHSLIIGFFTTVISVPLGSLIAWLMVRTDIPGKKVLSALILIPYMIPSWCKALAWLSVFRNDKSGSTGLLTGLGIAVPDWMAYGPFAIILVMCMHYYAFSYIMVSGSLRSINSELEEMGEIQGANKVQILGKITLPLVLPAFLSAAIMTISKSLGTYGVAARLGSYINYHVLATSMKNFLNNSANPKGTGYAMAILMILLASGTIFANQKLIGTRKSYATIGGKGTRSNLIPLGKAKWPLMVFMTVFLFIAMCMPLFVLIMESFQIVPGGGYGKDNLTLYAWIGNMADPKYTGDARFDAFAQNGLFQNSEFGRAALNTVKLSLIASLITAFCGQFFGYITTRGRGKWYGKLTEQLIFIPYLMPGVAFSAIYFAMFSVPRLGGLIPSLYGTFALILLVSIVKHFPFASRSGSSNMLQISQELEEAADINGAGFWTRIGRVVIPLAKNGFLSGLLLTFISIAKELDLIALLMTPENYTLSFLSFDYSKEAMPQVADAICIVIILFILVTNRIAGRLGGDVSKSM